MTTAPRLEGTVALVTGASSGIGRATALELARQGAAVSLVGRREDRLADFAAEISGAGGRSPVVPADIGDARAATEAVERTVLELGRLDTLVNNAGPMLLGPVPGADPQDWRRMVDVNLMGLMYCARAAVPHLVKAAAQDPRGVADIVNIGSVAGRSAFAMPAVYCAAEFGGGAFSEALRQELARQRVRVSVVEPGSVDTGLRGHDPAAVRARLAAYLGTSNGCRAMTWPMPWATSPYVPPSWSDAVVLPVPGLRRRR
ncbi:MULTISPECIES: SDR family NAD(P)-dependent oxidoreductase [unclassified Streptomyces]|uniref:SDR family NAD(P)-dependent oxidoreductase n=1 Tax=unclassified Streptomyces TaxID=2593676 RepID=UPI002E13D1E9|nr:SDR family NAD(P)-dependent oxidoreductase [Streptomyces sp. NBC_01207]WTA23177.1 SDR family NAD(P)-dependent oxidoreductase [Streptomyces sp. NBC_00853]